jgi:hypothetical protein
MTQRERILALLVGSMALFFVGFWGYTKVQKSFSRRAGIERALRDEIRRKELEVRAGRNAMEDLITMEDRSLPSDLDRAMSQSSAWLTGIIVDAGWIDPRVSTVQPTQLGNSGAHQFTSTVTGDCTLEQLVKALYEFYKVPSLSRISLLPIKPKIDSKLLKITMTIETLVLDTAPADRAFNTNLVNEFGKKPLEEYADAIVQRNMFAPANLRPRLDRISDQRIELGDSLRLELAASDSDIHDKLQFFLGDDAPQGVRIRGNEVRWQPDQIGTYRFEVVVQDDGIPPQEDAAAVTVVVSEPRPREAEPQVAAAPPKFDEARFTFPIASIEIEGEKQVWLQIRTKDEILRLKEGDPVKIGSIDGVITRIGLRDMVLSVGDQEYLVRLGDPLVGEQPQEDDRL